MQLILPKTLYCLPVMSAIPLSNPTPLYFEWSAL